MNNRITQLISAAERHIELRDYDAALDNLAVAERIEPNNKSIHMIKELVKSLQAEKTKPSVLKRFLSVTIDPKSPTGISRDNETLQNDIQRRIRSLTMTAEYFLSRGAIDNAFESLMYAYLLDPLSPDVLACEKRVLPAWQKLHGKSATEAKHEWVLKLTSQPQTKSQSSLFDRLMSGKLFD
jgi:hypothetical protein